MLMRLKGAKIETNNDAAMRVLQKSNYTLVRVSFP